MGMFFFVLSDLRPYSDYKACPMNDHFFISMKFLQFLKSVPYFGGLLFTSVC